MSSPAYLIRCCLSPLQDIWKLRCSCLTSHALACCALRSAALLYASIYVSWDIQDKRAFIGHRVLLIPPLISAKSTLPLI